MASPWKVRHYREGDEGQVQELFELCFHHRIPTARRSWIEERNPLGSRSGVGDVWVAEAGGRLVGHYAKIRYGMTCLGQECIGAQGSWMATHPDYRRLGIASELMERARDDSRENGVRVHFSFPNGLSSSLASKHRVIFCRGPAKVVLVLDRRRYLQKRFGRNAGSVMDALNLAKSKASASRHPRAGHGDVKIVEGFRGDAGDVWDSVKDGFDLGINRSERYLKWRYDPLWGRYTVLSAVRGDETLGYLVGRTSRGKGVASMNLCEFISKNDSPGAYAALGEALLALARGENVAFISAYGSPLPGGRSAMSDLGFRDTSYGLGIGRSFAAPALYPFDDSDRRRLEGAAYYYTAGDGDFA